MVTDTTGRYDQAHQGGNPEMSHSHNSEWQMYEDPAVINPDELATCPKQASADEYHKHYVNMHHGWRTTVSDGISITRTDTSP